MDADILIEDPAWEGVDLDAVAHRAFDVTLSELGLDPSNFSVSVLACNDGRIAQLNADFRGKPTPTNVLSWPSEDRAPTAHGAMPQLPDANLSGPETELGDIALAYGVVTREAEAADKPFEHHLVHLLVHGCLHLLGFDHINDADGDLMESWERRILARMGVPDPY